MKYVLKQIDLRKTSKKDIQSAQQEAKLLSKLKHPNIVSYKDSFESNGFLFIVMLYCEGGDLYTKIKNRNNEHLEETQIVEWFVQIAMALQVSF
jgi:NIMA (never in mitosis gene a)-related kinase